MVINKKDSTERFTILEPKFQKVLRFICELLLIIIKNANILLYFMKKQ